MKVKYAIVAVRIEVSIDPVRADNRSNVSEKEAPADISRVSVSVNGSTAG
jgi:hypothetical protein